MRYLASRRGMFALEAVMWIVRSLILVFVLLSIILVTSSFMVRNLDTKLVDSYVLMGLAYYSDNAMASRDSETGRVYPGMIDAATNKVLQETFSYGGDRAFIALKGTVFWAAKTREFFYDNERYNDLNFLYVAGLTEGQGGVKKVSATHRMAVVDSGRKEGADAKIEVVTKNA